MDKKQLIQFAIENMSYIGGCLDTIKCEFEASNCISKKSIDNMKEHVKYVTLKLAEERKNESLHCQTIC